MLKMKKITARNDAHECREFERMDTKDAESGGRRAERRTPQAEMAYAAKNVL